MSFWQKTMLWLGLGPDEMYEGMSDGVRPRSWPPEQNSEETAPSKPTRTPIKARLKENLSEEKSTMMESTGTVRQLSAARSANTKTEEPKPEASDQATVEHSMIKNAEILEKNSREGISDSEFGHKENLTRESHPSRDQNNRRSDDHS